MGITYFVMKSGKLTQKQMVLQHLMAHGSIVPSVAWTEYGCYRLGAVIYKLREEGYPIETQKMDGVSAVTGNPVQYAKYILLQSA